MKHYTEKTMNQENMDYVLDEKMKIVNTLNHAFLALFYIDIENNTVREIISLDNSYACEEKSDARVFIKHLVDTLPTNEYKNIMKSFTDLKTVDKRLGDKPIIVQEFKAKAGGWTRCSLFSMEKNKAGKLIKIAFGFRDITEEKETALSKDILIQSLSMFFGIVNTVNMETGEFICHHLDKTLLEIYGAKISDGNYDDRTNLYVKNAVHKDDRYLFDPVRTVADVKVILADKKTYSFSYRVQQKDEIHYIECRFIKPDAERNEFILAFKNIDEQVLYKLKQDREMELQRAIIEGIGSEYYSVLLLDPDTDTVTTYRAEGKYGQLAKVNNERHSNCWSKALEYVAKKLVSENTRAEFSEKLSLEYIRTQSKDYSFTYELLKDDGIAYLQIRVAYVRKPDGNIAAVVATRNIDDLIKKEREQERVLKTALEEAKVANEEKDELYSILKSMSEIYYSMHIINLTENTVVEYSSRNEVKDIVNRNSDAAAQMKEIMEATVEDEYLNRVLEFTDLTTLAERMTGKKSISLDFVAKNYGWFRSRFIVIEINEKTERPEKVVFTTQLVDEEKRREEELKLRSFTDGLTGLYNRHAYIKDISKEDAHGLENNFVYLAIDINGLKVVNDTMGHEAGDELIKGTAECILSCFGKIGKAYRTGGDEMVVIFNADEERLNEIKAGFDETMTAWKGKIIKKISASCGYVRLEEFPDASITELANIADKRMYEAKAAYYKKKENDRRNS